MTPMKIGFLHPGEMGISLAVSAINSNHDAFWCSAGRSQATEERATYHGLQAIDSLASFCLSCDIIISVCPPHAALEQADSVIKAGFKGIYTDVNAISPDSVQIIAQKMSEAEISFVDGGIIGQPAWRPKTTWLHLCGAEAEKVAKSFHAGPLETNILEGGIGQASALKMCFAANSKGVSALIIAILATAEKYNVRDALEKQWDTYNPDFTKHTQDRIQKSARKAWRFTGEMEEIAATLKSAGLPEEFHHGAANIYSRQTWFKDADKHPSIEEILKAVLTSSGSKGKVEP
jgi:3-hydroxyisobutyrate dehydrogenase-like beta-hydroxyacid dehydrogenase